MSVQTFSATAESAKSFVGSLNTSALGRNAVLWEKADLTEEDAAKSKVASPVKDATDDGLGVKDASSFLVGGQILSFSDSVSPELRAASINSSTLAQLQASATCKGVPQTDGEILEWQAAYVNTLLQIGWSIQGSSDKQKNFEAGGAEVQTAFVTFLASLAVGAALLDLLKGILETLVKAADNDPFITLYKERTASDHVAAFGAGLGDTSDKGFVFTVLDCLVDAKEHQQQVLFWKWGSSSASIFARRYDLTLNTAVYDAVKDDIVDITSSHAKDWIARIKAGERR